MFVKNPLLVLPSHAMGELLACEYCRHLGELGKGEVEVCMNPDSPHYYRGIDRGGSGYMPTSGCEHIELTIHGRYNGKINAEVMRLVPDDSYLRQLPLEKLVVNYEPGMPLGQRKDLPELYRQADIMWDLLERAYEKYGDDSVKRTEGGWTIPDEPEATKCS